MNTDLITNENERLKHSQITDAIIRSFYDVYNELGQGFLESVYREAMTLVLRSKGLTVEQEKTVEVRFRGQVVGLFRTDLVVENVVIVELKVARGLDAIHEAQLLNYLKQLASRWGCYSISAIVRSFGACASTTISK